MPLFCHLPADPWIEARLQNAALTSSPPELLPPGFVNRDKSRAIGALQILGMVLVKPGVAFDGPLTPWGPEAALQHGYYHNAADALSINIVDVALVKPSGSAERASCADFYWN